MQHLSDCLKVSSVQPQFHLFSAPHDYIPHLHCPYCAASHGHHGWSPCYMALHSRGMEPLNRHCIAHLCTVYCARHCLTSNTNTICLAAYPRTRTAAPLLASSPAGRQVEPEVYPRPDGTVYVCGEPQAIAVPASPAEVSSAEWQRRMGVRERRMWVWECRMGVWDRRTLGMWPRRMRGCGSSVAA